MSVIIRLYEEYYGNTKEEFYEKEWERLSKAIVQGTCAHKWFKVLVDYKICKKCHITRRSK